MAKDLRFALLLDCYGEFLTPHQAKLMELYYGEDLSLSEIAQVLGITRQGVRDGVKRGEQILLEMEEKLQFAARLGTLRENFAAIAESLTAIAAANAADETIQAHCNRAMEQIQLGLKQL
jgi:hypothetical protein